MSCTATQLINTALNEVGYLEKRTNAQLDSKTANAGYNNYTKYARDLDNVPGFYNGKKNGYYWCDVFVDWCFYKAFGADKARELLCQPENSYGASCTNSARYFKNKGQLYSTPKVGDQIFFGSKSTGTCTHTGIVYKVDARYVYTVEGNTSGNSGVVANGGGVFKKSYRLDYSGIYGYGRPNYDAETTEDGEIRVDVWTQKDAQGRILDIALRASRGSLWYQVHTLDGRWLPKVTGYDPNDYINGYAGNHVPIDAIRVYYNTPSGEAYKQARYAVQTANRPGYWLPEQVDDSTKSGMDGYAGNIGQAITDFKMRIDDK